MLFLLFSILTILSCKEKPALTGVSFKFPEQGQGFSLGDEIKVELDLPRDEKLTSATYLIDGKPVISTKDTKAVSLKTAGLAVGYKIITAIVERDGIKDTAAINVVLNSGVKPQMYTYKVVKTFPHDTSSYTEGLGYYNGKLLESTGEYGASTLRWVDLQTGKTLLKADIDKKYFGEGSVLIGDKIVMLTYRENIGFVYDAKSLKQLATFPCSASREGWGLTFDGQHLLNTDGSNKIWLLNKDNYKDEGYIEVYDDKGQVNQLNELEYIDGKIFANVYQKNIILVIDPKSGIVEKQIDLSGIFSLGYFKTDDERGNNVLNGIAWDKEGKRLFVTGKKWPKLFEIALVPQKEN